MLLVLFTLIVLVPFRICGWVLVLPSAKSPPFCSRLAADAATTSWEDSNMDDENDNAGDDDGLEISNPLELQRALRSWDNTFQQPELYQSTPNTMNNSTIRSKLQEMMKQEAETAMKDDNDKEEDIEDDDGSVFLDGDAYVRASGRIKPDGSLPGYIFGEGDDPEAEDNPYGENNDDDGDDAAAMQELIRLINERKSSLNNDADLEQAKVMRDKIFEGEEAFSNQSRAFLEGLGGNVTANEEATSNRRNTQYRKEQNDEFEVLEHALDEWQDVVKQKQTTKSQQRHHQQQNQKEQQPQKRIEETTHLEQEDDESSDEWVLVDDPSTGGQFYWNTATGEMKWDLDADSM
eukprot:scaffold333_cov133-Cylindrotheca_fusiformis.AAC.13